MSHTAHQEKASMFNQAAYWRHEHRRASRMKRHILKQRFRRPHSPRSMSETLHIPLSAMWLCPSPWCSLECASRRHDVRCAVLDKNTPPPLRIPTPASRVLPVDVCFSECSSEPTLPLQMSAVCAKGQSCVKRAWYKSSSIL